MSATGYNERTSIYTGENGTALSKLFDSKAVLKPDGSINHLMLDGGRCYNVTDNDRPVSLGFFNITGFELDELFEYPFEKEVCDMSRSQQINKHEQALSDIYEIIKEQNQTIISLETTIDLMKSELCKPDNPYTWCPGFGGGA